MIDYALVSLSFFAGIGIFFSPCGVALLPAYVGFLFGQREEGKSKLKRVLKGLKIGGVVSAGILTVFLSAGILISMFGNFLAPYAFWFGTGTGIALIILGIFMLLGKVVLIDLKHRLPAGNNAVMFYIFGTGYAIGGIGCTLPAFLLVAFAALSGGSFTGGIINFFAFSLGTISLMLGVTTATAVSKSFVEKWIVSKMILVHKLSAVVVLAAGAYLIWFNIRAFILPL